MTTTTSVKLDEELRDRVQGLAATRRRSPHWIMCEAIREYVDREEAREGFKREAEAAWASYQETGEHLTGAELHAWLRTWGTKGEKAAPKRHT